MMDDEVRVIILEDGQTAYSLWEQSDEARAGMTFGRWCAWMRSRGIEYHYGPMRMQDEEVTYEQQEAR